MCPMCIGTATLLLSGGGAAGGVAATVGYLTRKSSLLRVIRSLWRKV